jgi:predicted amidohydrolase
LINEVFWQEDGCSRLRDRLQEARNGGATLAVLPELPLNPWSSATKTQRAKDAEEVDGTRTRIQAEAAREVGIGVVGGAIVIGPDGERRNTALVIGPDGSILGTWEKAHIPDEPGFWEQDHYVRGRSAPVPIGGLGFQLGVQICSDVNRPQGTQLLSAQGAELVVAPRATELATWDRWRHVMIANALTCCCWVATANRPEPEEGVLIGGPSFAVAPDGEILVESRDPVALFSYDAGTLPQYRRDYPGHLEVRAELYAAGWNALAEAD